MPPLRLYVLADDFIYSSTRSHVAHATPMRPPCDFPCDNSVTDDFIYTVALTSDLKYCAYGGTAKRVDLCDGRTGEGERLPYIG
eukprot:722191-Prymnesium_polylepis.1